MIISFVTGKGGEGKSYLSASYAAAISKAGRRKVLLVDTCSTRVGFKFHELRQSVGVKTYDCITRTNSEKLHHEIDELYKDYDVVVIDTKGDLDEQMVSAVMASDVIVTPFNPSFEGNAVYEDTMYYLEDIAASTDRLFLTVFNNIQGGTAIDKDLKNIADDYEKVFGHVKFLKTIIHQYIGNKYTRMKGKTVFEDGGARNGKTEMIQFIKEVEKYAKERVNG